MTIDMISEAILIEGMMVKGTIGKIIEMNRLVDIIAVDMIGIIGMRILAGTEIEITIERIEAIDIMMIRETLIEITNEMISIEIASLVEIINPIDNRKTNKKNIILMIIINLNLKFKKE